MFSFFKKHKSSNISDFAALNCDMHSHLIPGIDDGSKSLEMSLDLIRGLAQLGYKKLITTPHIIGDIYPNTPEIIQSGLAVVQKAVQEQNIPVEIHAAAEYLLDDYFTRSLEKGNRLLTLKENWVLVELSFVVPAINVLEILFDLQMKGYQPVLAHPERYLYFSTDKAWYDRLKDAGCLFQINLLSLRGYYGKQSQQLADYLVKKKYVDLLGTDLHHERHLEMLGSSPQLFQIVDELLQTGLIRNPIL